MNRINELKDCDDIVDWLLINSFNKLDHDTKFYIINSLRPKPNLITLKLSDNRQNRGFNTGWYDKCVWLTGSIKREKLFCWQCLLFSNQSEYTAWSKTGYSDLKNLPRSIERHTKSKEHIASSCKLALFGKLNIVTAIDSARKNAIIAYNSQVTENRNYLRKLIDITIFLASQDLAFRGHNETTESANRGNYKELLSLFAKSDPSFSTFLNNNIFSGTSKIIQNDLIDCISFVLKEHIDNDIKHANFFSWQVDETTDISCSSQLSIIARYVKDGKVQERFLGFYDVSSGRTADDLFNLLVNHCEKYDFRNKLIAQTYDGAAVMASHLNGLQSKIKTVAPQALFTHCHAHALNLILSKACNYNKDSRIFFSNLSGFAPFFSKSTKRTNVLNTICGHRLPSNNVTRWNFTSRAVFTVHSHRERLIEVFNFIIDAEDFKNDSQTIREAVGLKNYLTDSKFCFLLEAFKLIFEQTDVVFSILQNKLTDINFARNRLTALMKTLRDYRTDEKYFNHIYDSLNLDSEPVQKKRKVTLDLPNIQQNYKQIFIEILDTVIMQIEIRFKDLDKLTFFDLLTFDKHASYSKNFPENLLDNLLAQYPFFDKIQLRNELSVVYNDPQMFEQCKTHPEILDFMFKNELQCCMPEFYKLLSIVLTIPVTSASVERSFSTLKRIKTYSRNTMNQNRLSNVALISVEKELVTFLSRGNNFYDNIIDRFANMQNRRIPLIFKTE